MALNFKVNLPDPQHQPLRYKQSSEGNGCFAIAFIIWLISVILSLGLIGLIIYVAHHFITKYW